MPLTPDQKDLLARHVERLEAEGYRLKKRDDDGAVLIRKEEPKPKTGWARARSLTMLGGGLTGAAIKKVVRAAKADRVKLTVTPDNRVLQTDLRRAGIGTYVRSNEQDGVTKAWAENTVDVTEHA